MEEKLLRGVVSTRKCDSCDHHEIGVTTEEGEFTVLRPGMVVEIQGLPELMSKNMALSILKQYLHNTDFKAYSLSSSLPEGCRFFNPQLPENMSCWYLLMQQRPKDPNFKHGRLICISKNTGQIIYEGTCDGEGSPDSKTGPVKDPVCQ